MRHFLVFVLVLIAFAPLSATANDSPDLKIVIVSESSGGAQMFRVSNPDGLEFRVAVTESRSFFEFAPFKVFFLAASGEILWIRTGGLGASAPDWGQGTGVVYAGVGDETVESPAVTQSNGTNHYPVARLNATDGWIVFAWDRAIENGLAFELTWSPGMSITFVAEGRVASAQMQDFDSGARVGAPAVARVNLGDELSFPDAGYSFATIEWTRTDIWGSGELAVKGAHVDRIIPLTRLSQDEDLVKLATEGGSLCICLEVYRWVFSEDSALAFKLDYIGDGGGTEIGILHVAFDIAPLPFQVSREWDLSPITTS